MVVVGVLLAGIGGLVVYGYSLINTESIRENVYIDNINVGGMSYEQATTLIKEAKKTEAEKIKVTVNHESDSWVMTSDDVQYSFDVKKSIVEAYSVGRTGNFIEDVSTILKLAESRYDIKTELHYNMDSVTGKIKDLAKTINKASKEATFRLGAKGPIITDDIIGRTVDVKKTVDLIEQGVKDQKPTKVKLVVVVKEPKLKAKDLRMMKDRLSRFYTVYDNGYFERAHNIRLATSKVNGALILPGAVLSVDKTVGPRTVSKGFKMSLIIVNNKYEDGVGGGLCQVSTTLYNAALYANLDIVARKNHSITSAYIAPGRDSTVFSGSKDLILKNNRKYPIYIKSYNVGGIVYFEIYGKKEPEDKNIVIRTSVVSHTKAGMDIVKDPTMYVGNYKIEFQPHDGYVVKTYKEVYFAGKKIKTVYLGISRYNKSNGVKLVGTKKRPVNPPALTPIVTP